MKINENGRYKEQTQTGSRTNMAVVVAINGRPGGYYIQQTRRSKQETSSSFAVLHAVSCYHNGSLLRKDRVPNKIFSSSRNSRDTLKRCTNFPAKRSKGFCRPTIHKLSQPKPSVPKSKAHIPPRLSATSASLCQPSSRS